MTERTIPWPGRQSDEAWVRSAGALDLLIGPLLGLLFTLPIMAGGWYLRREWQQEARLRRMEAEHGGRLLTQDEAAAYLRIRRAEFMHLQGAGRLHPADVARSPVDDSHLYSQNDLDALLAHPEIDWAAVRARSGRRASP